MDAAFAALRVDIKFLQLKLSGQCYNFQRESSTNAEGTLNNLCHLCEASLQFLQSLCQQKSFRERLVKNKVILRLLLLSLLEVRRVGDVIISCIIRK